MSHFSFSSLRFRLILLVLLAVIPALGLTFYTGLEQRRHAADHVQSDAMQLAARVSAEHERLIEGTRQFLYMLAIGFKTQPDPIRPILVDRYN